RLFLKDHPQVDANKIKELPNYPPASWAKGKPFNNKKKSEVTQIVYVGALSLETTYIKEFCEWICEKEGEMRLDVFSYNMTNNARAYLKGINSNCIRFFEEGVEYSDLPVLLTNYDVGVILYKPLIDNFKYNAPNKLFEYMACGL